MARVASPESVLDCGVDAQNPWPGLVPFTEELQEFFHGRGEEAEELLRRVGRKNLTVLFGQSGLGKSSLLQAGLFPRLRTQGYLPVSIRLDHAASAPPLTEQITAAVTRAILEAGGRSEATAADPGETLWEHFHRRDLLLLAADGRPARLVLVFDQFEELFAIGQASDETRSRATLFVTELADLIENRAPEALERRLEDSPELARQFSFDDRDYRVLVCLREDYLAHLESLRQSIPSISENRMRLTRMNGARALEAVANPGRDLITPEVGRQVVRFVAGGRPGQTDGASAQPENDGLAELEAEPALLCLVCRELNNRRLQEGLAQITADLLAGNRERILQDFYERCLLDQPPAVRAFVEDELVTDSGLRENIALERARRVLTQTGASPAAIDELVRRRLLRLEDRLDIKRVELTHDVLTPVVKKSRVERQQKEAALRAEQGAQESREQARRQRRRFILTFAGMAAALVLVSGFAIVIYLDYRLSQDRLREVIQRERAERGEADARRARAEALKDKARAEANQELADKGFEEARATVDELLTEMSQQGLTDVPGLQELRQRFAEKAVARYVLYRARRPDDFAVTQGHARSLTALGTIIGQVGSVDKAVAILEYAIRILEALAAKQPENKEFRFQLAKTRSALGILYRDLQQNRRARPFLEQSLHDFEVLVGRGPVKLEHSLGIVESLGALGGVTRDGDKNMEARRCYERGLALAQKLYDEHPNDMECLQSLMHFVGSLAELTKYDGNYVKALELDDEFLDLLEFARKRLPHSPQLLLNRGIGYEDKSDLLAKLKRPDEASKCYQEAIASYRSAAKENPLVSRYQWALANGLRSWAARLSSRGKFAEAKACYEESCEILDALTQRVDDRPMYGAALIESWERLAEFYRGTKGDTSDVVAQQQGRLRCLDQAIQVGRKLSKKFPDDTELHSQFAEVLFQRAWYDSDADRNKEAFPFYQECVEIFRKRVWSGGHKPTAYQVERFFVWMTYAQQCAVKLKRSDEVMRLAKVAYDLGKGSTDREVIDPLGTLVSRSADVHKEAGRYTEAIRVYTRALEIRKPALEKTPWHWFLRSHVAGDFKDLAECYQKISDFRGEVQAWREYLRIWSEPMHGMKIADYVDPARPSDEPEAVRLRQFAKSTPETKPFYYSYDQAGVRFPLTVFITNVPWPKDPLEDQARCVQEQYGGTIPTDVREYFRKLHKLAYENNWSFVDFCQQVLGASSGPDQKKEELTRTKAKLLADIVTLTQQSSKEPAVEKELALGKAYDELAAAHEGLAELKESIQAYERALQFYLGIQGRSPNTPDLLKHVARIESNLGNLYLNVNVNEYGKAYTAYQRSLDFWEQLSSRKDAEVIARAGTVRAMRGLGFLCRIAFSPTESAHWYLKAMEQDDPGAASDLASVYLEHPEVAATLPEQTRRLLVRVARDTKNDPRAGKSLFAQDVAKERKAQRDEKIAELQDLAAQYHNVAVAHKAPGQRGLYRKALNREFDIHGQRVKLNPADSRSKTDQAKVAAELAWSYLEATEKEAAVEWTTRAAALGHAQSLLQLSDWYEKGTMVKADLKKANHYGYLGRYGRGVTSLREGRYDDALADLKKVCESRQAAAGDYDRLGQCYGKLDRWDEAVQAYTRSVELDLKSYRATGVICGLLEALVIAEHPERLLEFVQGIEKKGWKLPAEGTPPAVYNPLFHGLRAIALRMSGKDASDAERMMRQFSGKPDFTMTNWTSHELEKWLKTTKLAPDIKAAVERIVHEMNGTAESLLRLADRYEKGTDVKVDLKTASHYRYLAHHRRGASPMRERRYVDALPDLKEACESGEADAVDYFRFGLCLEKLGRWDESIKAYTRCIDFDLKSGIATDAVFNLLEALVIAERPEQLLEFVRTIEKKGWKLPAEGEPGAMYTPFFHGFRAIALRMSGKDASDAERMMRQFTGNPGFKATDWTWDETNQWLKTTKLAPDLKAAVEKIFVELKRTPDLAP